MFQCKLTDQETKEQKDTADIDGDTSDLDTTVSEPPVEAIQSKDSLTLSLVDVNEMIIKDSFSEDIHLNATAEETGVIQEKVDSKKFTAMVNVCG